MNPWLEGIQSAIEYMESQLMEELDVKDIAAKAHVSEFYFQKIFHVLCGYTVSEYIRNRRLTLAAQELSKSSAKVIDIALKYGYESPDSFTRAFTKLHGITPSAAKERGANLQAFAPIKIKIKLEGGTMMEYKIVEKAAFTVMGRLRDFNIETSYAEIPKFWQEHLTDDKSNNIVCGMYGICMDSDGKNFEYLIADNYLPWNEIPDGYVTRVIPAGTWAVFPCRGELPNTLQDVNTKIWNEWLPNCKEYSLGGNYNVELYAPPTEKAADTYSEIWIPVIKNK